MRLVRALLLAVSLLVLAHSQDEGHDDGRIEWPDEMPPTDEGMHPEFQEQGMPEHGAPEHGMPEHGMPEQGMESDGSDLPPEYPPEHEDHREWPDEMPPLDPDQIDPNEQEHRGHTLLESGEVIEHHSDSHATLREHELGHSCLDHAEELERDYGSFDDHTHHDDTLKYIADKMMEHSQIAYGPRQRTSFRQAMLTKLRQVRDQQLAWGAVDICNFMLRHHDDL